jgi:D-glycerate 3-kinase
MSAAAQEFIQRNRLPESYLTSAEQWFEPLLQQFADQYATSRETQIWGINGCQGSGKSTLADYLCTMVAARHGINTLSLSMDDFYLTKAQRTELGATVHPMLATRGVPGTHDVGLMIETIEQLRAGAETRITRFDKSIDDRVTGADVEVSRGPLGLIIVEGWCWGARAEPEPNLVEAINDLEKLQDAEGVWRRYVNRALASEYQQLFPVADQLIMLQAPSFDTVYHWRLEQENKLLERHQGKDKIANSGIMNQQQVREFIEYFQRITEYALTEMPARAQHLYQLGQDRQIRRYITQPSQ